MNADIYKFGHGYPENKRKSILREETDKAKEFYSLEYKGKLRRLPVVEVPIELPVYRIENIRTKNLQKEWLATHKDLSSDFFTRDPYSIETQENQYMILETLVNEEDLLKSFESGETKQTEHIIVTDDGVVVNGNRRLAAWRKLYYSNQERYKHFQTITAAVLPDHDPVGTYELEVALQIKRSMKSEYKWHAIAADIKEKLDSNYDIQLIEKKQKKNKDAINTYVACYEYAQNYLNTINRQNEWSLVDDKEYAFKEIVKGRKNIKSPGEKELFSKLSNAILSVKAEGGRLYDVIPQVANYIDKIADELIEKYGINVDEQETVNSFGSFLDNDEDDIKKAIITNYIANKDDAEIVELIRNTIKNYEDIDRDKKKKSFVFDQVKKASSDLSNAIGNLQDGMSKEGIDKQIENIENYLTILKDWIKK